MEPLPGGAAGGMVEHIHCAILLPLHHMGDCWDPCKQSHMALDGSLGKAAPVMLWCPGSHIL